MMKINNKGFMMAEIIIVSTIIIGTLVGLYTIFNKLYINYKERSYYYNVDTVYVLKTIYDELIETNQMNILASKVENNGFATEIQTQTQNDNNNKIIFINPLDNNNYIYNPIVDQYGINKLIILKYTTQSFENLNTEGYSKSLKQYLTYLKNTLPNLNENKETSTISPAAILPLAITNFPEDYNIIKYKYIFIVEFKDDNNNYYYGNYRIG